MNRYFNIVASCAILSAWGCQSEQNTSLNIKERRILDSLYNAEATQLRINSDSICTQLTDSLFTAAVDSLLLLRREEVQALYEIKKDTNE